MHFAFQHPLNIIIQSHGCSHKSIMMSGYYAVKMRAASTGRFTVLNQIEKFFSEYVDLGFRFDRFPAL